MSRFSLRNPYFIIVVCLIVTVIGLTSVVRMGWALLIASAISATILVFLPATARRSVVWVAFLLPVCGAIVASSVYLNHLVESRAL